MLNTKKIKKKDIKYNIWLMKCIDINKLIKFKDVRTSNKY